MKKSTVDYHFRRKEQLANYKGNQSRLLFILEGDHGEAIKNSMHSPIEDKKVDLISKEEFFAKLDRKGDS